MKTTLVAIILVLAPITVSACAPSNRTSPDRAPERAVSADSSANERAEAHAAFDVVYTVLQHPRCLNCHPAGDRPLQYDSGRPHAMNVVRGPDDRGVPGMRCDSCHGTSNLDAPHMPPGVATGWRLAPRAMVFEDVTRTDLASMLRDPQRSHMSDVQMIEHVAHDPLVLWGWDPGPGRVPVPVPHAEFVTAFRTWIAAGVPVPPAATRAALEKETDQ